MRGRGWGEAFDELPAEVAFGFEHEAELARGEHGSDATEVLVANFQDSLLGGEERRDPFAGLLLGKFIALPAGFPGGERRVAQAFLHLVIEGPESGGLVGRQGHFPREKGDLLGFKFLPSFRGEVSVAAGLCREEKREEEGEEEGGHPAACSGASSA
jgi:hypothetical protein